MVWIKLNDAVEYWDKPALGEVNSDKRFMALVIDSTTLKNKIKVGIAREITKSQGNVDIPGFVDESKLIIVESESLLEWRKVKDLKIKNIENVLNFLSNKDRYFIGLEDPDILIDRNGIKHLYYTIAFKLKDRIGYKVYLGHAQGNSLENLVATNPVLGPLKDVDGFKETCVVPESLGDFNMCLNEILIFSGNTEDRSAVSLSVIEDLNKSWQYQKTILDPKNMNHSWIMGHASPCRFLPKEFAEYKGKLVGIVNGREVTKTMKGEKHYGKFRPGLFIFDYNKREISWIDSEPLIEDPEATTITFASDFIQTRNNEGIVYAHVNDSFVRAYRINSKELKKRFPN